MTAPIEPSTHHHPSGLPRVACIVAGIEVAPTDVQAARVRLAARMTAETRMDVAA